MNCEEDQYKTIVYKIFSRHLCIVRDKMLFCCLYVIYLYFIIFLQYSTGCIISIMQWSE